MHGWERGLIGIGFRWIKNLVLALPRAIAEYQFKSFFGKNACESGSIYLVLDPHENAIPLTPVTQNRYRKHFFGKRPDILLPGADPILGSGSVRATTYANSEAGKYLPLERDLKVRLDSELLNAWDGTFICYGSSSSNVKTYDVEHLAEMNLYQMTTTPLHGILFPCWRMNGQDYTVTQISDRAVLARLRNPRSPGNYLFVCAGLGEWGSTGAVWYLFRYWKTLHKRFKNGTNFCLILDIETNSDESAREVATFSP